MSTDLHTEPTVLHFGIIPLPPMGYASIARHDDPAVETTVGTWGRLSAVVAGTWQEWGIDPDSVYADDSLHVSVTVPAGMLAAEELADVAESVHIWLGRMLDRHSRVMDYCVATDADWSEGARVVTFNSSGPNVWPRPARR